MVLGEVDSAVRQATSGRQRPWTNFSGLNRLVLKEGPAVTPVASDATARELAELRRQMEELRRQPQVDAVPPAATPTLEPVPEKFAAPTAPQQQQAAVLASPPPPAPPPAVVTRSYPVGVGQSFRDTGCPGSCPELMVIPEGSFTMGSPPSEADRREDEGPQRRVTLREPLALGRYHVTVAEYRAFVTATRRADGASCFVNVAGQWVEQAGRNWHSAGFPQTERDPVVCVNWDEAQAYVAWLSQRTGQTYRLPSEAEFEYAVRGGTTTRWWWGEDGAAQCRHANGADRTYNPGAAGLAPCADGFSYTSPVGRFAANGFKLHDMAGNAWQWLEDCYAANYAGAATDASAQQVSGTCASRVLRGGSWGSNPQNLRSASRDRSRPDNRVNNSGFRVARTPGG